MLGTVNRAGTQIPDLHLVTPTGDMRFEVVHISSVRALVYTYPEQGGLREVALIWRTEPRADWRCALCNLEACMHLRAFQEAPKPTSESEG
ncbi:MAG TPA: hypothetical protein VMK65_01520 [Longimicrobiales bacterium]|nr:hypothetical protein [Longimicrobiales bacterium]